MTPNTYDKKSEHRIYRVYYEPTPTGEKPRIVTTYQDKNGLQREEKA